MSRLVYMGSPQEAIAPLEYLAKNIAGKGDLESRNYSLVGVVSAPARKAGRGRKLVDPPVAQFAKEQGFKVLQPLKASDPVFLEELERLQPDIIVTCAYGQILTKRFLAIPRRATINIHPSRLPEYRGATPVQAALLSGDESTAVTILFTVKALDAGNVILQQDYEIAEGEKAGDLLARLFANSGKLLVEAIDRLEDPAFVGVPQDASRVSHCQKIDKEDGLIDWNQDAAAIVCRHRAYHPWPGSFTYLQNRRIGLEHIEPAGPRVAPISSLNRPGSAFFDKANLAIMIRGRDSWLKVSELKPAGSRRLSAADFWNGLNKEVRKDGLYFSLPKESS